MAVVVESNNFGQVKTPVRFWRNEKLLYRNRKYCANMKPYAMLHPSHYLPDFTIVRPARYAPITIARVEDLSGTALPTPPFPTAISGGFAFDVRTIGDKNYITYYGRYATYGGVYASYCAEKMTEGLVQIRIGDGIDEWVSEPLDLCDARYEDAIDVLLGQGSPSAIGDWVVNSGSFQFLTTIDKQNLGAANTSIDIGIVWNDTRYYGAFLKINISISVAGTCNLKIKLDGVVVGNITTTGDYVFYGKTPLGVLELDETTAVIWVITSFTVNPLVDEIEDHLKLSWSSECDIDNMFNRGVNDGIKNEYFFPAEAEIGRPEYKLSREGSENGNRKFIPSFRKRTKRYVLEAGAVPEHILDALYEIYLFDDVTLTMKDGIGSEPITDIAIDSDWLFNDHCLANAKIEFGFDDDAVKSACCDELPATEIIPVQLMSYYDDIPVTVNVQDRNGNPVSMVQNTNSYLFYQVGDVITFSYPSTKGGHGRGNDAGVTIYVTKLHTLGATTTQQSSTGSITITMETDTHYLVQFNYDLQDSHVGNMYPPIIGTMRPPSFAGDTLASISFACFYGTVLGDYTFYWTLPDGSHPTTSSISDAQQGTYTCAVTFTGAVLGGMTPTGYAAPVDVVPVTFTFEMPLTNQEP